MVIYKDTGRIVNRLKISGKTVRMGHIMRGGHSVFGKVLIVLVHTVSLERRPYYTLCENFLESVTVVIIDAKNVCVHTFESIRYEEEQRDNK